MPDEPPDPDVPEDLRSLLRPDADAVAALYNGIQGMGEEAFAAAFDASLSTLREAAGRGGGDLAIVLGLELDDGTVADATVLSVTARADGSVLHAASGTGEPDSVVYLPVRPTDCPPGSGGSADDLGMAEYREIVASMVYVRYELLENEPDRYDALYREPLARGLAAYADE